MLISILHPSRSRPHQAAATAKKWLGSAKRPELIEYIISIDMDDPADYGALLRPIKETHNITWISGNNKSAIEAINNAAHLTKLTGFNSTLLITVSDDFDTPHKNWDEALRSHLEGKSDYLVKTNDGAQPWIITLPIMDRVYYNRFGYVYHPDYKHLFCDTAMTHVGHMLGRVIELPIKFTHNHYTTGAMAKDAINVKNDKTWAQGEEVYISQLMNQFGLSDDEIVNPINRVHPTHLAWLKTKGIDFVKA